MVDTIELDGENAFLAGQEYLNPYTLNSDSFNRYERGWFQAQKKSAVGLLNPIIPKSEKEFPLLYPRSKEPVYKPPHVADQAEEYRKRKG